MSMFQVVAECAHATVDHPLHGRTMQLLLKGALIPEGAPELPHLLSVGMVAPVPDTETGGLNADGVPAAALEVQPPADVISVEVPAGQSSVDEDTPALDVEVEARRAAARAKLPDGGVMPDGRASKDVWVEFLVSKGSRYEDVAAADKTDLVELAKQRQ